VIVGSGLVAGHKPWPELAGEAVETALAAAGLSRAEHVVLLLSREFSRQPGPAVLAAARAAGCLQVSGCTASGLFTERGWQIDQPAAAALVLADCPPGEAKETTLCLSLTGHGTLPYDWQSGTPRAGLLEADAATWQHGRLVEGGRSEIQLPARLGGLALSTGLRILGKAHTIEQSAAYELRRVGGHSAVDSLYRALPAELRDNPPLHQLVALRRADEPAIAILTAHADGSLTLGAELAAGDPIHWAIRQPLASEQDMRQSLKTAAEASKRPDFALMFSCIGRGPLFYGDDDRDLLAFREQFPDTPLLGAYGSGQIVPVGRHNHLFHNSVITLLFESAHV